MKELTPLEAYIIIHLRKVESDYAKSIARVTELPIDVVVEALESLEQLNLIERTSGSAVKRENAKLKWSSEVRKHHTYYTLSKEGKNLWKKIRNEEEMRKLVERSVGQKGWDLLKALKRYGYEHAIMLSKILDLRLQEVQELLDNAVSYGLVVETKPKTLKMKDRKAKPKKETRCLHKYYKLSRLGELLLRSVR